MDYDIDIIVSSHDDMPLTAQSVIAIYENTNKDIKFRVSVVDDSTDLTPQWCEQFGKDHDNFQYLRGDEPFKNFASIWQWGVDRTDAKYLANVNNSCTVEPMWLDIPLAVLDSTPSAAVVGLKILCPSGAIECAGVVVGNGKIVNRGFDQPAHRYTDTGVVDAVGFATCLFRRDALEDGWTSEPYVDFGGFEDIDTCLALHRDGWQILYSGQGAAYHKGAVTRMKKPDFWEKFGQNKVIFRQRWADVLDRYIAETEWVAGLTV